MHSPLLLLVLFYGTLLLCTGETVPDRLFAFEDGITMEGTTPDFLLPTSNATTDMTTDAGDISENKTIIEPAKCNTNDDCREFHVETASNSKIVCDQMLGICIIAIVENPNVTPLPNETTTRPKRTPSPRPEEFNVTSTVATNDTPPPSEINSIPVVVWVLFTIPFISIIVLGIICGRRLKMQSENIQENLMRTTINGVHVDQLLSQRDLIASLALSRPPPTYEKATGEIPPSYETFLQALQEKRQSIFQCNTLMNEEEPDKENNGGSVRSQISNHHRTGRGIPVFAISRNNHC